MDLLRLSLQRAGCPDEKLDDCLNTLRQNGVCSTKTLRDKLKSGDELYDLLAPHDCRAWKKEFRILIEKGSECVHMFQDVEIAFRLCELSYGKHGDQRFQNFQNDFKVLILDILKCPVTSQIYAIAVVEAREVFQTDSWFPGFSAATSEKTANVLVVAYAGTHQASDWLTNLTARTRSSEDVGGSAHSGFLRRADFVKFPGLKRLQESYQPLGYMLRRRTS